MRRANGVNGLCTENGLPSFFILLKGEEAEWVSKNERSIGNKINDEFTYGTRLGAHESALEFQLRTQNRTDCESSWPA